VKGVARLASCLISGNYGCEWGILLIHAQEVSQSDHMPAQVKEQVRIRIRAANVSPAHG
jgi:hypothetical protein